MIVLDIPAGKKNRFQTGQTICLIGDSGIGLHATCYSAITSERTSERKIEREQRVCKRGR